ncbi:MAG TPA: DUF1287 domain-containing protein, partial [Acidobacteriaceae bacterium]
MLRRTFLHGLAATGFLAHLPATATLDAGSRLVAAARAQMGITTDYDGSYASLAYPNGDVPRSTGVCADVVVRAGRDALGLDLQKLVHEDIVKNFGAYPRIAGMKHPDSNIDHRRVLILEAYWRRAGCQQWAARASTAGDAFPKPLRAGDCLTWMIFGRLTHVGIVSSVTPAGAVIVHNIGRGVEEIDMA